MKSSYRNVGLCLAYELDLFSTRLLCCGRRAASSEEMSAAKRRRPGLRPVDRHERLIVRLPRSVGVRFDVLEAGRHKFIRRPAMQAAGGERDPADTIFAAGEVARFRDAVGEKEQAIARFHSNLMNRVPAGRENSERQSGGADLLHAVP